MRNGEIDVVITMDGKHMHLKARGGRRLKELLRDAKISVSMPCGGNGRCGKCVITFVSGAPKAGTLDRNFLSDKELLAGKRLLCRCILDSDCAIDLSKSASSLSLEEKMVVEGVERSGKAGASYCDKFGIAIDIGTTTVVAALVGRVKGGTGNASEHQQDTDGSDSKALDCIVIDTRAVVNHQRQFGADVISRIDAAADPDTRVQLQDLILSDIGSMISQLITDNQVKELSEVVISGNTTMIYLLLGNDASGLGVYPYKADELNRSVAKIDIGKLFGEGVKSLNMAACSIAKVRIMPGISAFVGADIVSGLYYLNMADGLANSGETNRDEADMLRKALFIDLGTNGEMAYYDGNELRVTSTAAGPVFEGGGISCGVASVPGAISHVTIEGQNDGNGSEPGGLKVIYEIIGDTKRFEYPKGTGDEAAQAPVGLCGTGVIEAVAELRRNNIINSDGLLSDKYFENGFLLAAKADGSHIAITQQDIRNVQLAKAAINAGMDTLLAGDKPGTIYIAGGFGAGLNEEKIRGIRLFSKNYCDNINVVGNSSLRGAVKYLENVLWGKEDEEEQRLAKITDRAKEIVLAGEESFDERYMDALGF